jgi:hypothetical protein
MWSFPFRSKQHLSTWQPWSNDCEHVNELRRLVDAGDEELGGWSTAVADNGQGECVIVGVMH